MRTDERTMMVSPYSPLPLNCGQIDEDIWIHLGEIVGTLDMDYEYWKKGAEDQMVKKGILQRPISL